MELSQREETEHDEDHQQDELRPDEGRLGALRRRQRVQKADLLERLDDADEAVEIDRDHGGDDIDPAPKSPEMKKIQTDDGERQEDQRQDADTLRRRERGVVKEKSGDAGEDQEDERKRRPAGHALALHHGEGDDHAGNDPDEADQDMDNRECVDRQTKNHDMPRQMEINRTVIALHG